MGQVGGEGSPGGVGEGRGAQEGVGEGGGVQEGWRGWLQGRGG